MNVIEAHGRFALRKDRSALTQVDGIFVVAPDGGELDCWPAGATAAVMHAGMLDDAKTDADLDEALDHFNFLYSDGIVTRDDWSMLTASIVDTVYAYCQSRDAEYESCQ